MGKTIKIELLKMVLSIERWKGNVAVVTGASSGIGAAICDKLVEAGLKVAGLARRIEVVEAHSKNLTEKSGYLLPIKCDLNLEQDIIDAFKRITEELGPISILVNSAGIYQDGNLTSISTEDFQKTWSTNVLGLTIATREATQNMLKTGIDGHVIHINSIAGHKTFHPGSAQYSATKHAVRALTNGLRLDLNAMGSKIKVSVSNFEDIIPLVN